jgi:translocation and assembly module TamB
MSLWKKISLGVLIFSAAAGYGGVSGGDDDRLHLVFNAADRWVPGLEIGKVTGGWRDLTLEEHRYEQPGVAVTAGQFHLGVKLRCLWDSSCASTTSSLRDIYVAIDTKKMPPSAPVEEEDSGPLNLSTPYPIALSGWRCITSISKSTTPPCPCAISPPA